ncbi:PerC family transcriptional regulator [Tatumella sp. UBA2305]|uniref:PerC family transcriptional regulator n=1 Tax=Tatumella sp. UBA2305 TaxID=1947647 RepID=UPI0025D78C8D|nr:PerC family transcriptional regulator [Tatumella sp. UBA2305]
MVRDDKAEKLEQSGLYRRALSRWLIVLDDCKQDAQREWIIKHRAELTENVNPPKVTVDNFSDVTRAATATQDRMGLSRPNGSAFRLKGDRP